MVKIIGLFEVKCLDLMSCLFEENCLIQFKNGRYFQSFELFSFYFV